MKTLTDTLIRRLNAECTKRRKKGCARECDNVGWCQWCWEHARSKRPKDVL